MMKLSQLSEKTLRRGMTATGMAMATSVLVALHGSVNSVALVWVIVAMSVITAILFWRASSPKELGIGMKTFCIAATLLFVLLAIAVVVLPPK
jgi:hypothetical protein